MRILVAEDYPDSRELLKAMLARRGHDVVLADNGGEAFEILNRADAPPLAIVDWMMPVMSGIELCRVIRERDKEIAVASAPPLAATPLPPYIIMLTARNTREDMIAGLHAGADDFISKPFDDVELRARINVAGRVIHLQQELAARVRHLEQVLGGVRQLQGLLPICSYCKSVRDDRNYWQKVDDYITMHTGAEVSHGICPACYEDVVQPQLASLKDGQRRKERLDSLLPGALIT